MTADDLLRFVHVLFAVTAVGANLTYSVWLAHAAREPEHLDYALRGIALLDSRVATPSYIMLLVTGVALVLQGTIPWRASWLVTAIGLYAVAAVLGAVWYAPMLRAQVVALRRSGLASDDYRTLDHRARTVSLAMIVVVLAVVYLMVTKPRLW
ncbi:MAG TPA: DUF2269 family protein [bacterium]|nr:DUF2269 family protein [bacterium]